MAADCESARANQGVEPARRGGVDGTRRRDPTRGLRLLDRRQSGRAELIGLNLGRRDDKAELCELSVKRGDIGPGEALGEIATLQDHVRLSLQTNCACALRRSIRRRLGRGFVDRSTPLRHWTKILSADSADHVTSLQT
jgi:hypothetical protein